MSTIDTLTILIPTFPLAAALLTAALGPRVLRRQSHWPVVVAVALSCLSSMMLIFQVHGAVEDAETAEQAVGKQIGYERIVPLGWTWANVEQAYHHPSRSAPKEISASALGESSPTETRSSRDFDIEIVLRADPLTAIMLATVTFISLLVAVYSIGYMRDDPGYWRFFSYLSLFVFSMTMLVSVSNFVMLYVFWEAVGLCSYLLIGFWFQKPEAAAAGKKAFLVNRVGDFGFALGIFLLWTTYGTLNFHDSTSAVGSVIPGILGQTMLRQPELYVSGILATAICVLLMLGACGKSAQFPLHVWLPDAMEGPTPVSALIHAATMVTAGVYMVVRCTPLFLASAEAPRLVALIGGVTALMAALIALTQTDLKRILAYSTISQLGYMFLGVGTATLAGVTAGMFHLFTHAFFKALLFLGAGSVMHATSGLIDIRQLGGLRHRMPTTWWTFLFGSLALAGVLPFAGFWSKDLILAALAEHASEPFYQWLYVGAIFTAFLTAFYTFRALFLTFHGENRLPTQAARHVHESPPSMTMPLIVLAAGSLVVGAYFEWNHAFADFLHQTPSLAYGGVAAETAVAAESELHLGVAVISTVVALAGIGLAWFLYLGGGNRSLARLTQLMQSLGLYRLSQGKFFFDQIYDWLVVEPLRGLSRLSFWIDRFAVDGLVNLLGALPAAVGTALRPLQNGLVQFYALAMVLGLLVLIGALLM